VDENKIESVRLALQRFQDGYTARDVSKLDEFMQVFVQSDEIEMIGVGASKRGGPEWFQGIAAIREIVEGDWSYWGVVRMNVEGAKITVLGSSAWLSTDGVLISNQEYDKALPFYINTMKELLEKEELSLDARVAEATQFGVNRLRDRIYGVGHPWPFTFTAVLVYVDKSWHFHTIHWSFPAS
jgi:hypothetical protein